MTIPYQAAEKPFRHSKISMVGTFGTSPVRLVHLVSLMQPSKPDRPNRPNEQDRLADFFNILLPPRNLIQDRFRFLLGQPL